MTWLCAWPSRSTSILSRQPGNGWLSDKINYNTKSVGNFGERVFWAATWKGIIEMTLSLSPVTSEFETEEQEASYDRWFRAQVQASLDDDQPCLAHDAVMAEMDAIIANVEQNQRKRA